MRNLKKIPFEHVEKLEPWIGKDEVNKWKSDWKDLTQTEKENTYEAALYMSSEDGYEYLTSLMINKEVFMDLLE